MEKTIRITTSDGIDALIAHATSAVKLSQQRDIIIHWEANMEFHMMLCGYRGNQSVEKAPQDVPKFCSHIATQYFSSTWEKNKLADPTGHMKLVEMIRSQNLEQVRRSLIMDINAMKNEITQKNF